jgi:hypothetical protein
VSEKIGRMSRSKSILIEPAGGVEPETPIDWLANPQEIASKERKTHTR